MVDYGNERAIEGWDNIAAMFNMPVRTMLLRRKELIACGAIFYRRKKCQNHVIKVVCAFPSQLKLWQARKTIAGEKI